MDSKDNNLSREKINLLILAYIAFVTLGLPTGLLGVAWPTLRTDFSQPLDAMGFLFVTSTIGYFNFKFLYRSPHQPLRDWTAVDIFQRGIRYIVDRVHPRPRMECDCRDWRYRRIRIRRNGCGT